MIKTDEIVEIPVQIHFKFIHYRITCAQTKGFGIEDLVSESASPEESPQNLLYFIELYLCECFADEPLIFKPKLRISAIDKPNLLIIGANQRFGKSG